MRLGTSFLFFASLLTIRVSVAHGTHDHVQFIIYPEKPEDTEQGSGAQTPTRAVILSFGDP